MSAAVFTPLAVCEAYGTADVAEMAGVSLRMIGWWTHEGAVLPVNRGSHTALVWPRVEIFKACILAELRRKRGNRPLRRDIKIVDVIAQQVRGRQQSITELYAMTDGERVRLEDSKAAVIERMKDLWVGVFVLDVGEMWRRAGGEA